MRLKIITINNLLVLIYSFCYSQLGWLAISPFHQFAATKNYWIFSVAAFLLALIFFGYGLKKLQKDPHYSKRALILLALPFLAFFWQKIFPHNRVLNAAWYFQVPLFSAGLALFLLWYWPEIKIKWKLNWLIWAQLSVFLILFLALSLLRHWHFQSMSFDLGIYDNLFWRYAHGLNSWSPIRELNLLGDHFHPIFFLFVPFYKIFPRAETIVIIQALLVVISGYPIYLMAKKRFKNVILANVLVFAFLSFAGIQAALEFDFHAIAIAVPLLVFAFYFLVERRWFFYFLFTLFALGSKEDVSAFVFTMGLYAFFFRKERVIGTITALLGLVAYFLILKILIPHFQSTPTGYFVFRDFGTTPPEIVKNALLQPKFTFEYLFNQEAKITSGLTFFASFGFLPLLAPSILVLGAPQLAEKYLSDRWVQWGLNYQYSIPLALIFAIGAMTAIAFLAKKYPYKNFFWACALFLIISSFLVNFAPGAKLRVLAKKSWWQVTAKEKRRMEILSEFPENVSITALSNLVPHLTNREKIYLFGSPISEKYRDSNPDYLIFILDEPWSIGEDVTRTIVNDYKSSGQWAGQGPKYQLFKEEADLVIFKKNENFN